MPGLVFAAAAGNLDDVKKLLDNGADIDAVEPSPLISNLLQEPVNLHQPINPLSIAFLASQ